MRLASLGADPEVFVKDLNTDKIVSAIGLVPGTKEDPYKTPNGWIHYDNVMAEMNVTPAKSAEQFVSNTSKVLGDLRKILASQGNYDIEIKASHEFDEDELLHADARKFFCVPDFDAWGEEESMSVSADSIGSLRSAGGHIHIGISNEHFDLRENLIRYLDLHIGVPLSMLDKDVRRREIYGRAGRYRNKPYGVEYRVPSNVWLKNKTTISIIFKVIEEIISSSFPFEDLGERHKALLKKAVNNRNIKSACLLNSYFYCLSRFMDLGMSSFPKDVMEKLYG